MWQRGILNRSKPSQVNRGFQKNKAVPFVPFCKTLQLAYIVRKIGNIGYNVYDQRVKWQHKWQQASNMLPHFPGLYVYVYVVWKAATSATMLMVNDLTRYKCATLPLHIRYTSATFSASQRVDFTQRGLLLGSIQAARGARGVPACRRHLESVNGSQRLAGRVKPWRTKELERWGWPDFEATVPLDWMAKRFNLDAVEALANLLCDVEFRKIMCDYVGSCYESLSSMCGNAQELPIDEGRILGPCHPWDSRAECGSVEPSDLWPVS